MYSFTSQSFPHHPLLLRFCTDARAYIMRNWWHMLTLCTTEQLQKGCLQQLWVSGTKDSFSFGSLFLEVRGTPGYTRSSVTYASWQIWDQQGHGTWGIPVPSRSWHPRCPSIISCIGCFPSSKLRIVCIDNAKWENQGSEHQNSTLCFHGLCVAGARMWATDQWRRW